MSQTQTQSPSSSATPSVTRTSSITQTRSQTRSQTATQTGSGFPLQPVFDNTAKLLNGIDPLAAQAVSPAAVRGVLIFWPETDPVCGPGTYRLASLSLSLASPDVSSTTLLVRLFAADPDTFQPTTLLASSVQYPALSATPQFMTVRREGGGGN